MSKNLEPLASSAACQIHHNSAIIPGEYLMFMHPAKVPLDVGTWDKAAAYGTRQIADVGHRIACSDRIHVHLSVKSNKYHKYYL